MKNTLNGEQLCLIKKKGSYKKGKTESWWALNVKDNWATHDT